MMTWLKLSYSEGHHVWVNLDRIVEVQRDSISGVTRLYSGHMSESNDNITYYTVEVIEAPEEIFKMLDQKRYT